MEDPQPLLLCMENASGEEVILRIEPEDDFQTFKDKARSVLGYDVDISSLTKNQHVEMTENVYKFLINLELSDPDMVQSYDQPLDPNDEPIVLDDDQLYVLDDGTQIRASQIHFDNEDAPLDLSVEQLPFIKVNDDNDEVVKDDVVKDDVYEDISHKIIASPVPTTDSSPKHGFINHVPFKLVCNNTTGFEAQFTKYLEASNKTYATLRNVTKKNKSPRSLIRDNFNDKEEFRYTREEILNMLKDSPVTSIPYENNEKKHVRKTDPTKMVQKTSTKGIDIDGLVIGDGGNRNCFICGKNVSNDKIYLFDKEDQKIHKCSPQKKMSTQLKIICENCLNDNFTPSRMKGANQFLNSDEYLVIRNNQQYIFQKTKNFKFRTDTIDNKKRKKDEFVKFEIGSDGEIVTKPIDEDAILAHDRKDSSSDVEIVEAETEVDKIIDNLEEADEDVKVFLGKYEAAEAIELKCRFCDQIFCAVSEVIEHGETHKHVIEDDVVFPCPLCDYGYATFQWLRGHLMAAHDKKTAENTDSNKDAGPETSSITTHIRSSSYVETQGAENISGESKNLDSSKSTKIQDIIIKTEVKQEAISSDDEIWIVQTADDESQHLSQLLEAAKLDNNEDKNKKCHNCSNIFPSSEALAAHKCRGNKRKPDDTVFIPTDEDFLRRAEGRPRPVISSTKHDQKKYKKTKDLSEPQIVTCHNCNQSFTSKVRLKFHMQFHDSSSMMTEGEYKCAQCEDTFATETQLFDHLHFTHEKIRRWKCPVEDCGKTFYLRATLTKHSRIHTDTRRYVCVTCGKRFLDKQTLDEHGVTHLQIKPYQCHICLKQLTRVSRLRMHVRAHEEALAPTLLLVCRLCCRAFRDYVEAQEHALKSTECLEAIAGEVKTAEETVQLSPTSGIVRQTIQVIESPTPKPRVFRQVSSPIAAPLLSTLTNEATPLIRVVEVEKAFRCEYCEDVFYTEDGLNVHRAIHKGVKNPFTCHICKVTFATYSRCTTHKTTHGFYKRPAGNDVTSVVGYGDFPTVKHFLCEDCGRSYLHWTYLQVHRRMKHPNNNYLHNCNQCEMTFPNSWSLSYHRKKLHGKTALEETKPTAMQNYRIPCRDCDEVLPNKTALYKHRKKEHTGVSMQDFNTNVVTGSACTSQGERITTVRTKLLEYGVRAWACARCPKRFRIRSELRAHTRLKHPAFIAVIEVQGTNISPEDALNTIIMNNISQDRVIEINVMSFAKGTTSIVPTCARALSMLGNVPHTPLSLPRQPTAEHFVPPEFRRRVMTKNPRRPAILRADCPITEANAQSLQDLNVQLLLQDGVLVNRNQIQMQNDSVLLE